MADGDADIQVAFGGQIKSLLGKIIGGNGLPWGVCAFLLYYVITGIETRQAAWRETLLQSVKDQQTTVTSHVRYAEIEARQAEESRRLIADYMLISCYNAASDAVQRRRCIEREIPTEDRGAYGPESARRGRR